MMAFQDEKSSSEINDGRDVGLKQMLKTSNMCMSEIVIKCPECGGSKWSRNETYIGGGLTGALLNEDIDMGEENWRVQSVWKAILAWRIDLVLSSSNLQQLCSNIGAKTFAREKLHETYVLLKYDVAAMEGHLTFSKVSPWQRVRQPPIQKPWKACARRAIP